MPSYSLQLHLPIFLALFLDLLYIIVVFMYSNKKLDILGLLYGWGICGMRKIA